MFYGLRSNPSFPSLPVDTGFLIEERKVLNEAGKSRRSRAGLGMCLSDPCSELWMLSCSYFEK